MTQKDLLESVLEELLAIKKGIPKGDFQSILTSIEEIEQDISELKYMLLNPEDGIVVKTNKNTEFRLAKEKKSDFYAKQSREIDKIIDWKDTVTKALWVIFTTLAGILLTMFIDSKK